MSSCTAEQLPSYAFLEGLMLQNYQIDNLVNEKAEPFKKRLKSFLQMRDYKMEGFTDPTKQRDLSIRFHWGHYHDFGAFALKGWMDKRHISLLAVFIDKFKAIPQSLEGLRVLDIGCWTGGMSLLLCAMGAQVTAIEEVKKYVDCLNYLKYAFDIRNLEARHLSLYECTTPEFQDAFDIVLFAGVLYHVTDPVLAMRLTYNSLKDGGVCLVETHSVNEKHPLLVYQGPTVYHHDGTAENLDRTGWNWFFPSSSIVPLIMSDVGYEDIRITINDNELMNVKQSRVMAIGKRTKHQDMLRAGLSNKNVR